MWSLVSAQAIVAKLVFKSQLYIWGVLLVGVRKALLKPGIIGDRAEALDMAGLHPEAGLQGRVLFGVTGRAMRLNPVNPFFCLHDDQGLGAFDDCAFDVGGQLTRERGCAPEEKNQEDWGQSLFHPLSIASCSEFDLDEVKNS